jgi:hypothetical protein
MIILAIIQVIGKRTRLRHETGAQERGNDQQSGE